MNICVLIILQKGRYYTQKKRLNEKLSIFCSSSFYFVICPFLLQHHLKDVVFLLSEENPTTKCKCTSQLPEKPKELKQTHYRMGPNSTGLGVSHSELLYQHFSIRLSFYWTFFFGNFSNLVLKKKFLQLLSNRY